MEYGSLNDWKEEVWTTADGRQIPFHKVTHQHWSNIYHYHLKLRMYAQVLIAMEQLNSRFGGVILPYNIAQSDYEDLFKVKHVVSKMDKEKIVGFIRRKICPNLLDYHVSSQGIVALLFKKAFTEREQNKVYDTLRCINPNIKWCTRATTHRDSFEVEIRHYPAD